MIVLSMVLVVVGFVLLMLGVLGVGESPLDFVYYSIGACLLAAVFLIIGVIRGRPSKKPVAASGGEGKEASWSGASAWNDGKTGESGERNASTAVLDRDQVTADEQPRVQVVAARDVAGEEDPRDEAVPAEEEAPADQAWASEEEPQEAASPTAAQPATPTDDDGAHVVIADGGAMDEATAQEAPARKATAKRATAKKATASRSAAGKGAARDASTGSTAVEAQKFEDALMDVSGVGAAKRRQLLTHFGTYTRLRSASVQELSEVPGISQTLATRIRRSLDERDD